jgi:hypothetical protein
MDRFLTNAVEDEVELNSAVRCCSNPEVNQVIVSTPERHHFIQAAGATVSTPSAAKLASALLPRTAGCPRAKRQVLARRLCAAWRG